MCVARLISNRSRHGRKKKEKKRREMSKRSLENGFAVRHEVTHARHQSARAVMEEQPSTLSLSLKEKEKQRERSAAGRRGHYYLVQGH